VGINGRARFGNGLRDDFYGLSKGWLIIFVIFLAPTNNGANPVNKLVADGIQDQHGMLPLTKFANIVVL